MRESSLHLVITLHRMGQTFQLDQVETKVDNSVLANCPVSSNLDKRVSLILLI